MVQSINEVLEERGKRYGAFMGHAQIAQSFHLVFEQGQKLSGKNRFSFTPDELEGLNMIFHKIARITNGDPHYSDSWRDIAGYATLVADRLDNDTIKKNKLIEEEDDRTEEAKTETGNGNQPTWEESIKKQSTNIRTTGNVPVRLEVRDGIHESTSQTQPRVPEETRQ